MPATRVVKFYNNDQPGAVAALKEYVDQSQGPAAKAAAEIDLSYIELAHRDATAADKALDNSIAVKAGDPYWPVLIAILRGSQREYAGRHADAVAILNRLSASIQALPVPASQQAGLEALRLVWLAQAQAKLGQADATAATAKAAAAV